MTDDLRRDRDEGEACLAEVLTDAHNAAFIIEAVEQGRKLIAVACNLLRGIITRRTLHDFGVLFDLLDECHLGLIREQIEFRLFAEGQSRLLCLAENAADAGMRILDVVDRVVIRLLLGEIEVEIQLAVERTHEEEVAGRIRADLVLTVGISIVLILILIGLCFRSLTFI